MEDLFKGELDQTLYDKYIEWTEDATNQPTSVAFSIGKKLRFEVAAPQFVAKLSNEDIGFRTQKLYQTMEMEASSVTNTKLTWFQFGIYTLELKKRFLEENPECNHLAPSKFMVSHILSMNSEDITKESFR